jgi:protein TonB
MKTTLNFRKILLLKYSFVFSLILFQETEPRFLLPLDENQYKFFTGEKRPLPIDGIAAFMKKITYPESAIKSKTEGMIYLLVFIDEKGEVDNVKVVKGIGSGCDEIAVDVIKKTRFAAGFEGGVAVKAKFPMVINFQIPK